MESNYNSYGIAKDGTVINEETIPSLVTDAFEKLKNGKGKVIFDSSKNKHEPSVLSLSVKSLPLELRRLHFMPELARFKGIMVDLHWFDNVKHNKPHVHAEYSGSEVTIAIDGEVLDGDFPAKQLKQLRAWLTLWEDELYDAWNKAIKGENPGKVG